MKIIKLSAIDSTNDFLKKIVKETAVESGTVVQANYQIKGRGQLQNTWQSEVDKNLLFSVLYKFDDLKITHRFYLNKVVSITVSTVLKQYITNIKIKWPNDIMALNNKIAGVLIENIFNGEHISQAIIGVGLNVNQDKFKNLPKATSLKLLLGKDFDIDFLLLEILDELNRQMELLKNGSFLEIDKTYIKNLYRYQKPSMYHNNKYGFFMAKIIDVTQSGLLIMKLENEQIRNFDLKEIQFL